MDQRTKSKEATPGDKIKALAAGKFKSLAKVPTGGALQARKLPDGTTRLYWRYTAQGKSDRVAIGVYDASAPPKSLEPTARGFSIAAALERCKELAKVQAEHRDAGGYRAATKAKRAAYLAQELAEAERQRHTLRALLNDYCDHLERLGRRSHKDARSIFTLHVFAPRPKLADMPAANVTGDDIIDLLRAVADAGKGRTSNKLRSYLHAAYRVAMMARASHDIPARFKAYGITANPVGQSFRAAKFDRPDKNPLSESELRAYWTAIKSLEGIKGAALRLHLLTGGQRIEQLLRLRRDRVKEDRVTIYDIKGKPGFAAREHVLPLIPAATAALRALPTSKGEFAISTDGGVTPINAVTLTKWAQDLPHGIEGFQLKRVRSGVETMLSACGVSRDIRGELQSHGLTGVQKRHYDAHDYLPEKRRALVTLLDRLEGRSKVRPISKAA